MWNRKSRLVPTSMSSLIRNTCSCAISLPIGDGKCLSSWTFSEHFPCTRILEVDPHSNVTASHYELSSQAINTNGSMSLRTIDSTNRTHSLSSLEMTSVWLGFVTFISAIKNWLLCLTFNFILRVPTFNSYLYFYVASMSRVPKFNSDLHFFLCREYQLLILAFILIPRVATFNSNLLFLCREYAASGNV